MARFKLVDRSPRFLPIVLESQLIPGSFEHALDVLVDTEIDLSRLAKRFCNDETGAPAYDPAVMLKIVLLAYSRGVISSRRIERLCRENVLFMAISGDSAPQFSTIATFVRELGEEASAIFTRVLLTCDRQGLIGRQMFAIDGVKLPSNADKQRSGTHAELLREAERMEKAVTKMVKAHRARDAAKEPQDDAAKERARIERLHTEARRIRDFLATHEERRSEKGAIRKSNVTDNDSAKMATSKGVIQGYAQRKSPWGHGGRGRGREGTDHRRCAGPWFGKRAERAPAYGGEHRCHPHQADAGHRRCRLPQRGKPKGVVRVGSPCPHCRWSHAPTR